MDNVGTFLIGQSHKDSPHLVPLAPCDRCAVRHMQSSDVHGSEPKLPIPRVHRHQLIGGSGRLHLHTGEAEFDFVVSRAGEPTASSLCWILNWLCLTWNEGSITETVIPCWRSGLFWDCGVVSFFSGIYQLLCWLYFCYIKQLDCLVFVIVCQSISDFCTLKNRDDSKESIKISDKFDWF